MEIDYQCKPTILDYVDVQFKWDILLKPISVYEQVNYTEDEVFFFHGDHVGPANLNESKVDAIQYGECLSAE